MPEDRHELRILVLAPIGRDGPALAASLARHGVAAEICHDLAGCIDKLTDDTGALLLTQEGLSAGDTNPLVEALDQQPSWSALPVIVLVTGDAGDRPELLTRLGLSTGVVTLLERPVRQTSLVSTIQVALAARRRQYEVRDLLREQETVEHRLREQTEALKRSHALLDAVLDSLPVGVVLADAGGRLVRWNQAHEIMWGVVGADPADTPDVAAYADWKAWRSGTDEVVRPHEWTLSRALLEGRAVSGMLVDIQPFDGGPRRTTMNAGAPVRGEDGAIIAAVAAQMDVTDMLRMERALRDSEDRFRTLADNIAQFAWMADPTGHIFWYNRRWFDYTGTTLEEVEGWGWRVVHHPDHVERVVEKFSRSIRAGEVWEDLFPLRGRDGEYRWFLSRAIPLRDDAGRVIRWFGTNTDVTEQRQAQEALREADRRKDEFLATLAHELRNPLAPIRTAVELLRLSSADSATIELCRDIIERQTGDLTRLVDDLLEVSRITRGKVQLRRTAVRVAEIVERAVEASRPLLDAGGHDLNVSMPDRDLWLHADTTRLTQVLTNLLNNAASYTPHGGRIDITVTADGDRVALSVRDTGIGISPDQLSGIFETFAQVRPVLERPNAGLGIGLSLAKGLVELHDGTIAASSEGEGLGSEFLVTLPMAQSPADAADAPATAATAGASLRILVVDDNRDAADGLAMVLRHMGHDPLVAYDGRDALTTAEREMPDAVLLDIGLPAMNGYEVARRIRRAPWGRRMKLVAQTGWGNEQDRRRASAAGFDHHLIKPLDANVLEALLAGFV